MSERKLSILDHFANLKDPRRDHCKLHPLSDILVITLCAVLSGADSWPQVHTFGVAKQQWLARFLQLPHAIPSHDTFRRVFMLLEPRRFEDCFVSWMNSCCDVAGLQRIHIDGKTLRGSRRKTSDGICVSLHSVSAWAGANHLTLGQVAVEAKSNEITAIPEMLKVLDLKGCIVTIDAIGCQKNIARQIVDGGGDYVLALKGNHPTLYKNVESLFEKAVAMGFAGMDHDAFTTHEKTRGRQEKRTYLAIRNPKGLPGKKDWANLVAVVMVTRERQEKEKYSLEHAYYISSAQLHGQQWAEVIRGHWSIENNLHWVLDVVFVEDDNRTKDRNAARNLALVRRLALSLLKRGGQGRSTICERKFAGWNEDHLDKLLDLLSIKVTEDRPGAAAAPGPADE